MSQVICLTHIVNPFAARPGSEHEIASRLTWRTLRVALDRARSQGLGVRGRALVLPGEESAIALPEFEPASLSRTVQDVVTLRPRRPLPLIGDLLSLGCQGVQTSHIVFSNMDIAVQPHFYLALRDLINGELGPEVPFTVSRINIDARLANAPLEQVWSAVGGLGHGYDCFVMPRALVDSLDLGNCCVGAPHFDQLLLIELDLLSGHRARTLHGTGLALHLGNDITWAAHLDYVEHNLKESLQAIGRIKQRHTVRPGSLFDHIDRRHFQRNAAWRSALLRKVRRVPVLSQAILQAKRLLGRQF